MFNVMACFLYAFYISTRVFANVWKIEDENKKKKFRWNRIIMKLWIIHTIIISSQRTECLNMEIPQIWLQFKWRLFTCIETEALLQKHMYNLRMCVCQCYYIFQYNIIIDSKCACGFIREDDSHLFLNCLLYVEQGTVPFYLLHHHNIRRYIRTLLFGDSQKTWLKIVCNQKQYRHSLRTLSDSLKGHNPYTPPPILLIWHQYMFCIIHAYILIIHHAPYQTYVYMMLEGTLYKL